MLTALSLKYLLLSLSRQRYTFHKYVTLICVAIDVELARRHGHYDDKHVTGRYILTAIHCDIFKVNGVKLGKLVKRHVLNKERKFDIKHCSAT